MCQGSNKKSSKNDKVVMITKVPIYYKIKINVYKFNEYLLGNCKSLVFLNYTLIAEPLTVVCQDSNIRCQGSKGVKLVTRCEGLNKILR